MDVNDINFRLERVYSSIGEKYKDDVEANSRVQQGRKGKERFVEISFCTKNEAQ